MLVLYDMSEILNLGIDVYIGRSLVNKNKIFILPTYNCETYANIFNALIAKFPKLKIKSDTYIQFNRCAFNIVENSYFDDITKGLRLVYFINGKKVENYHGTLDGETYNFLYIKGLKYITGVCIDNVLFSNENRYIKFNKNTLVDIFLRAYD